MTFPLAQPTTLVWGDILAARQKREATAVEQSRTAFFDDIPNIIHGLHFTLFHFNNGPPYAFVKSLCCTQDTTAHTLIFDAQPLKNTSHLILDNIMLRTRWIPNFFASEITLFLESSRFCKDAHWR